MSLRTKILAAVVGLNLAVLVLAVLVLLFGVPHEGGVPIGVLRFVNSVAADPGDGPKARAARAGAVDRLREHGPGVTAAIWLEEGTDRDRAEPRPVPGTGGEASTLDVERAVTLHRKARQIGQQIVQDGELLELLPGARDEPPDPAAPPVAPRRQSLYVKWRLEALDATRARTLYFTLLGGIVAMTALGWILLSRRVVRPLATLAGAADRMAGGDLTARVETSGGGDEFDRTAQAFNRMAGEIAEHQSHLEDRVMAALSRVRKAEQHLAIAQRLGATGKLASGIAHEINNPLGGMRNAVKALQRGGLDAVKTAEYLELVQDGLARVEETVKKVLQFTPRTPSPRSTDLGDVARKAAALARHRTERKGIEFVERIAAGPVRVYGDAHELQQVALNLLLNAADAVPGDGGGGGRVELEVLEEDEHAVLVVRDDGVGMAPDVLAQCFDLFFTTKPVGEGTGLGLAVVHNIVTNHGGRIDVESAPGLGTTFRVTLPREHVAGGDGAAASPMDAPGHLPAGGEAAPAATSRP